jgi:hypothetical protein
MLLACSALQITVLFLVGALFGAWVGDVYKDKGPGAQ